MCSANLRVRKKWAARILALPSVLAPAIKLYRFRLPVSAGPEAFLAVFPGFLEFDQEAFAEFALSMRDFGNFAEGQHLSQFIIQILFQGEVALAQFEVPLNLVFHFSCFPHWDTLKFHLKKFECLALLLALGEYPFQFGFRVWGHKGDFENGV